MARPIKGETAEQFIARLEKEAVHYDLPAGQNPGDPYYGKEQLDPSNPVDHAVIISRLDRSTSITDEGARVLDWAKRVATADLHPTDRAYLGLSRDQLAKAIETLKNPDATAKASQTATGIAIIAAFQIGEIKGRISTALWGRKAWPRGHTDKATKERVKDQLPAIEARRERVRALCIKKKWPFNKRGLPTTLARKFGDPPGEKRRTPAALQKLYARDLAELAKNRT
jgi:hypothetical protein